MVSLELPRLSHDRRRGQPDQIGQGGGPRTLQEDRRVISMRGLDAALANRLVVVVAEADVVGHGQPEDGQEEFVRACSAPLGVHGQSGASSEQR